MRKLILYIASSIDGYIAGLNGELDWLFTDQDYGYNNFLSSIDTVLVGRKTFDDAVKMGMKDPFPGKVTYVFTRSPNKYPSQENLVYVNENPSELWKWLRNREGGSAWLVGGAEIIEPLLEENLIDEYIISIHPIVLGNGIPMFKKIKHRTQLLTKKVNTFDSGLIQISLEPQK
jgi:dihydrofolate reductase